MAFRKHLGYAQTLGHHGVTNDLIYIDIGARNPDSSIKEFHKSYPRGKDFYTYAFEADATFMPMYNKTQNLTYINAAVSTFDGP
jgi:hypothetical protein